MQAIEEGSTMAPIKVTMDARQFVLSYEYHDDQGGITGIDTIDRITGAIQAKTFDSKTGTGEAREFDLPLA
jgi:hypothetical protein